MKEVHRGEVWWADLPAPVGSAPGFRRPVVIIQAESFNQARLNTVIAVTVTTTMRLAQLPGNVLIASEDSGLPEDSVVNVTQVLTLDRQQLDSKLGRLPKPVMNLVDSGLKLILELD